MRNQERHRQSSFQKWIPIIGLIFIIGFFGSMMWSSGSYSKAAIISEQFVPSNNNYDLKIIDQTPETNKKYLEHQYLLAENHYKNNDFTKALETYDLVLKNKKNTAYDLINIDFEAVEWNRILMIMGKTKGNGNESRREIVDSLEDFTSSEISETYKKKAYDLVDKFESFWYGWAN